MLYTHKINSFLKVKNLMMQRVLVFWNIKLCSLVTFTKVTSKKQTDFLASLSLASCIAYSLILKMEAACSSETSVNFYRTTMYYIPKYSTLNSHAVRTLNPIICHLLRMASC
jgi:hypothetical protein